MDSHHTLYLHLAGITESFRLEEISTIKSKLRLRSTLSTRATSFSSFSFITPEHKVETGKIPLHVHG